MYGGGSKVATGGGFFPEANAPTTYVASPLKKANTLGQNGLRPMTIKQLLEATLPYPDSAFQVDSVDVANVEFAARVHSVREQQSGVDYVLEDGNGSISAKAWPDKVLFVAREGQWIRAVGQLKSMQSNRYVTLAQVTPITDYNQITFLFQSALLHHRKLTASKKSALNDVGTVNNFSNTTSGDLGYFKPVQQAVMNVLEKVTLAEGMHIIAVIRSLQSTYAEHDVRDAVNWLSNEGYIYNTIDSDHIRKC